MRTAPVNRPSLIWGALLAGLTTLILFLPSLGNGFVNWDDAIYVYENTLIQTLDPGFIKWAFTNIYFSNWHPLTMISYAVDYALWGYNPFWYHLDNVILHGINASLVFILSAEIFRKAGLGAKQVLAASLVSSLLFGIHPLHVESVSWISERKDVLSGFFFFLALMAYIKYAGAESKRALLYGASLALFALALMSKPMVVTFPAVILILDLYPLGRLSGGLKGVRWPLMEKIPFFAFSVFSAVATILAQRTKAMATLDAVPLAERVITSARGVMFYIYKMVLPVGLAPLYRRVRGLTLSDPWFIVSVLLIVAISVFCVIMARRQKAFLAGWLYYLITLSPVLGLIQVGKQGAADRYTYLPSLGIFMLAAAGAGLLYAKHEKGWKKIALRSALVAALAVLSVITVRQQSIWKDTLSLWTRQVTVYPEEFNGWFNRARLYKGEGMYEEAIADLNHAIDLKPDSHDSFSLRGNSYKHMGRPGMAFADMTMAIALKPDDPDLHYNLSLIYTELGMTDKAIETAEHAARLGSAIAAEYAGYLRSQRR